MTVVLTSCQARRHLEADYSLSQPETEALGRYIQDSLTAGIIRPSFSPAGAGFFFVAKKMALFTLVLIIGGLNDISQGSIPSSLMSSAFELLHGSSIFSKLDLGNAYHLVRIR